MKRPRAIYILMAIFVCRIPSWSQDLRQSPNYLGDESSEQLQRLANSRQSAQRELRAQSSAFETPAIASALRLRTNLIAIATITAVQPPNTTAPRPRVTFHVERYLRGQSDVVVFDAESRWNPQSSAGQTKRSAIVDEGNYRESDLDKSEPKTGKKYILGYNQDSGGGEVVLISGAVDLQDAAQQELIGNIQRFLAIEAAAGLSGQRAAYLGAVSDIVPWIRDIAMYRLTEPNLCYRSQLCSERVLATIKRQLQSDNPNERRQALDWLVWIRSTSRPPGYDPSLPILSESTLRSLFDSAIDDENVFIGDEAFQFTQDFEVHQTWQPGKCFLIIPALRKTVYIRSQDQVPLPPEFPLIYLYGCIPSE